MFWGLIMEPNKRYTQIVEKAFHVSMATLDVTTADEEIVQVMLCYENRNYLLCNLKSGSNCQSPLDLHFKEGTKIAFTSNGRGHVHLTGYLLPDDELDDLDEMEEEEEDEEEEEEVEVAPQLVAKQSKRKAQTSPTDNKSTKRLKALMEETVQASDENSDDDDDDDSEAEVEDASLGDDSEEDDDEEEVEEEEEDSDEDEEDEVEDIKPQPKKNKQQQPQQKQQQPQPKQKNQKAEKQQNNLSNGKETKSKQVVKEAQPTLNNSQTQKKKVLTGGIQIEDIKVGTGAPAKQGKFVSVYYIGRLKNGKKFDATTSGDGFKFRLGKGEVIKGWDIGVQGMKIGGKRRITIPPAMAYGAKGSPPVIPGNSTLTFEVELKNVH